jgi:hypothetical protein
VNPVLLLRDRRSGFSVALSLGVALTALMSLLSASQAVAAVNGQHPDSPSLERATRDRSSVLFTAGVSNGTSLGLVKRVTVVSGSEVEILGGARNIYGEKLLLTDRDQVEVQSRIGNGAWVAVGTAEMDARFGIGKIKHDVVVTQSMQVRFVVTPVCRTTNPDRDECRILTSNPVSLQVAGSGAQFSYFVGTSLETFRGRSILLLGILWLKSGSGREPAIDVNVELQKWTSQGWERVAMVRTSNEGVLEYDVAPERDTTYRWTAQGFRSVEIQVKVIEPSAQRLAVSWPPYVSAFGKIDARVSIINLQGDVWRGSTGLSLQYRVSRTSNWVTISTAQWNSNDGLSLQGKVQGAGYYRVIANSVGLENQVYYS